jgi:hypothetical protein
MGVRKGKKERKPEGWEARRKGEKQKEKKERQKDACVCRCYAVLQPLPVPSWTLLPTLIAASPHSATPRLSFPLALCPRAPSLALTPRPRPKHSTPLPLCHPFSHPPPHFSANTASPPVVCCVVCVGVDGLSSEKKHKFLSSKKYR